MLARRAMSNPSEILREARTELELTTGDVELQLGLPTGCLAEIEEGRVPLETARIDGLARFYGPEPADIAQGRPIGAALTPVATLLRATGQHLPPRVRSAMARVAAGRRELKRLEQELGRPDRLMILRVAFPAEEPGADEEPLDEWRSTALLMTKLREKQQLGDDGVASMRELAQQLGVELIAVDLGDPRVAGFSMSDASHGPAIIVNLGGANANPLVRRWTVAHELCHVLYEDADQRRAVQLYDAQPGGPRHGGPRDGVARNGTSDTGTIESVADRFAANLLAPDGAVRRLHQHARTQNLPLARQVQRLMEDLGITFAAACERLMHACSVPEDQLASVKLVSITPARLNDWHTAEATWQDAFFACRSVPEERRGYFARLVVDGWRARVLDRRQALELLHAAPDEPLEELLGTAET